MKKSIQWWISSHVDYQVIKSNQSKIAESTDFTGKDGLCKRVQISLPLLLKSPGNVVKSSVPGFLIFTEKCKGNQKGNQTYVRIGNTQERRFLHVCYLR